MYLFENQNDSTKINAMKIFVLNCSNTYV